MGIQFTGLASGLDTQSIIADLMQVEYTKVENVEKKKTLVEWEKDAWDEVNTQLYDFYKTELFDFKSAGTYNQKSLTNSNDSIISLNDSNSAVRGSHSITVDTMAKGSFLTGAVVTDSLGATITSETTAGDMVTFATDEIKTISISLDGGGTSESISITASDTMSSIIDKIEDLDMDLNVNYDSTYNRLFLSSTKTGDGVQLQLDGDDALLTKLGFDGTTVSRTGSAGDDADFTYNGTSLTSSSNEISVNGLSFNITGEGGSSTISVAQDTDAIYETVKTFILKYNELMLDITEKVGADYVADDYEPLTDDEKAAMTDDEIELWEDTIKDSILRRDDNLTAISNSMRNTLTLSSGVDTSDFTYKSLSALGVVTGGYSEGGLLHIEGDEDDSLYSIKDNKLREAIEDDPDAVMELLTGLGNQLYGDFQDRMKSSTISSAFTFYNDKYLDNQVDDYEDDIYDLEDLMDTIETRYYSQFTAMEQAIQQSNSTGDWLSQQLAAL